MSPKTTSTALAVILALGAAPLLAQTTDATAETAEATTEAAPATEAPAEAPAGEATAAEAPTADAPAAAESSEPPVGAYYPRAAHGDWTLRCIKTADAADPCELYQLMKDGQGNSVAEITLIPLDNGGDAKAGATVVTPLETDLTQGIRLQVDAGQAKAYPFNFCAPVGCVSRVGLTADELNSLKRGKAGTVSLLPYGAGPDQIVTLPLSLTGFTSGYAELETAIAEMREAVAAAQAAAPAEAPAEAPAQ